MFNFDSTKKDILGKTDKSNVGSMDKPIVELCDLINDSNDYFTTSSCSGRITLIDDKEKKSPGVFLFRSHEKVEFEELKSGLIEASEKISSGLIFFKQEPCLVVVSCRDKNKQWELFSEARNNGWKKSGILSLDRKTLVELMSSENISFPVIKEGEILVSDEMLKIVLEKANGNLEKGWEKIESLRKLFE
jgi:tRNA wybutosine-synthesizing protein 3